MTAALRSVVALLTLVGACAFAMATAERSGSTAAAPSWFESPRAGTACFVSVLGNWLICRRYKPDLALSMKATGRPRKGRPARYTQPPPIAPELLYLGNEWSDGDFTCVVRRAGLVCRNKSRHGWRIGKAKYRLF